MEDGSISLNERLDRIEKNQERIEEKLDLNLERDYQTSERVNTLETQYKFWIGIAAFAGSMISPLISFLSKFFAK